MLKQFGVQISKQGLDKRFNEKTVEFIKKLIENILNQRFSDEMLKEVKYCKAIKIKDSTCFQLPEQLKETYPGS